MTKSQALTIRRLTGREILDSRGRPTVWAQCELADGTIAGASAPSGASTGRAEAWELRDGDKSRYRGLGCRRAAANVGGALQTGLAGQAWTQSTLDAAMVELDGTSNKSALGANAILAVSLAFARAAAVASGRPLYRYFSALLGEDVQPRLPGLTVNLFSGGKHAGGQVPIQDVLVVPVADSIDEGLARVYAVYQAAADLLLERFQMRLLRADEGGLAPPVNSAEAMLALAVEAIERSGLVPGQDVSLALDVASSHFFENGRYHLDGQSLSSNAMIDVLQGWIERYPIISLEDGLSEEDWEFWPLLRERLAGSCLVLGDDFLCTNPGRIQKAIDQRAADALLLKVNQIGTLSEAAEAYRLAKSAGWHVTISARSGETEDDWLADLATGWRGDHIKIGSITQSERLAKYNRLLLIEGEWSAEN